MADRQQKALEGELFRLLVENVKDYAIFVIDPQGRVESWNPGAERLLGYREEEMVGQSISVFFTPEDIERGFPQREMQQALEQGRGNDDRWHVRKDGSRFWCGGTMTPLWDVDHKLRGFAKIMRDRTEWKVTEEARQGSEARQAAILATALDAIITIDHEGRAVEFNPAAERMFGYAKDDVRGRDIGDLIVPPGLREVHQRGMAHYLATGEGPVLGKRIEMPALRADGSEFPVELAITRIPTDGPPLFTAYLRDISEPKRAEQHRSARLAVTHVLSEAASVGDGASGVLRAVCENLGWDVGFFWTVNHEGTALRCTKSWHGPGVRAEEFETASCARTFEKGEGLPGRVWASGRPTWILDIAQDANFPRLATAVRYDLHSAFACPVVVGEHTLGVIEFFTGRIREPDAELLEMMGTVAGNIGQFYERKSAEEQVRQSERELADFFDNATVGLHWVGADGTILRANRAELAMLGYSREEYVGRPIADFHADEDVICDILGRLQAGEELHEYPARLRCKDGSIKDVLIDSSVLFRGEEFVHTRCFTRDVTEQRQAREALASSEERLRLALDAGRMGVWDWNVRTGELKWSDSLEPLHGLAPGTFGGTFDHFRQLIHPEDRETVNVAIRQAMDSGGEFYVEFRNVRPNGGIHWIAGSGKVFAGDDGPPLRMIGIGLEVTHRKRSEQTARFLAEASAALAVLVDFDSTLQKVASLAVPSFADWVSVDVQEDDGSLRRVAVAHVDPAKVQLAHEVHRRFPADPTAPQGVWNILRTGRSEIVPEITDELLVQSVKDDELLGIMRELGLKSYLGVPLTVRGKTLGVITFINAESGHQYDDTDLAVAEDLASRAAIAIENAQLYRELRDADQRKDEFLATLAHELRNPLAPIRNGLQVLRLAGGSGEMVNEARSMMERQLSQMVRLVDDLLDVSRITRNKLELRKVRVSLAAVVTSAAETSRPLMEQAGHTFSLTLPPAPVYLDADLTRLAQVFSNLLNNAAKYTEPGGRISLTGEVSGGEVVVEVRDNGLGIPADALPRIFEMFSQVDRNMERAQGGLGIGLNLVRRLVELHGGTVEVRSDGPGRGSQFVVRLPVVAEASVPDEPDGEGERSVMSALRILIVDDNRDGADSLSDLLGIMGNETRTAHDGLAAVETAEKFRPDLIVLDIGLPKLNGYEACRRIREKPWGNDIVIVAATGWGQEEDRRRSQEAGFDHHLVKPVDAAEIIRLLAEAES